MSTATLESTTSTQLVIPGNVVKSIASMANFAEDKNSATRVLTYVKLSVEMSGITAWATDRYVIGKATFDMMIEDSATHGDYYLDAAAIKLMSTAKVMPFTLTKDGDTLTVSDYTSTVSISQQVGNYPAIETLLNGHQPGTAGETRFTVPLLAKLLKVIDLNGKKIESWVFTPGTNDKPNSPWLAISGNYSVLIQPARLTK